MKKPLLRYDRKSWSETDILALVARGYTGTDTEGNLCCGNANIHKSAIDSLCQRGLVIELASPNPDRRSAYQLTEQGRLFLLEAKPIDHDALNAIARGATGRKTGYIFVGFPDATAVLYLCDLGFAEETLLAGDTWESFFELTDKGRQALDVRFPLSSNYLAESLEEFIYTLRRARPWEEIYREVKEKTGLKEPEIIASFIGFTLLHPPSQEIKQKVFTALGCNAEIC